MSTARTNIDFDRSGKQTGFIDIAHSPHEDAWGATRIPIAVIRNGKGPTVILEGGNHGDEYEGPITLGELIRDLDPGKVQGRVIFCPPSTRRRSSPEGAPRRSTDSISTALFRATAGARSPSRSRPMCRTSSFPWAMPISIFIPAAHR